MVDWSARSQPSPKKPTKDAIYIGHDDKVPMYCRTRHNAMHVLYDLLDKAISAEHSVLLGFDFAFGYPNGFAETLTGKPDALAVWEWLAKHIEDDEKNQNNRFDIAAQINLKFIGDGPLWGCPANAEGPNLSQKKGTPDVQLAIKRQAEQVVRSAQPVWKLFTTGSVGSQTLLGLPRLQALRKRYGDKLQVWPLETGWNLGTAPITLVEIYPSMLTHKNPFPSLDYSWKSNSDIYDIEDAVQVRGMCEAFARLQKSGHLTDFFKAIPNLPNANRVVREEGWILGAGHSAEQNITPPPLKNDCFALPPGVHWTPVDDALNQLRQRVSVVTSVETIAVPAATGRVLSKDVHARRSNPPLPNSAVDGYGFAQSGTSDGPNIMPLIDGRAAAGVPYDGTVPTGHAVRILTGAVVPDGVDTVVLEEDVTLSDGKIAFHGPLKRGANTRMAGEDVEKDTIVLKAGRVLTGANLALLSATGVDRVDVRERLKVAVLSTGDELRTVGENASDSQIYDANRPMLISLVRQWGFEPVDIGRISDDPEKLRQAFDQAAQADVILTSGGASAGDEDHVSALLNETGSMSLWRIAVKPGRPLAMGMWKGTPVFGLPGNPVAAFTCALIFARPAMLGLAGAEWPAPVGFQVPAAFAKSKKPGRREYLRARLDDQGHAKVFKSEGSGRISGLSWADGFVEIEDQARDIKPGDMVRYIPFGSFGI
ncbi:molybdopterin molybdenumtransferase MoeA [Sulfitobacter sp. 1151]|uniref:Molybdopterin molybdenumtransferase n=2 Tax=Parasulfitobacter algicola TaxID=2614809 RepID=A0ABX2IU66_9RHOB|nr:gephyrin-like molybdotransferase Glp [Sulfitobacter algicola]NSX53826.1 molybdopterin molybdenumtransferase MoeA [Sulfitobacter algicola]